MLPVRDLTVLGYKYPHFPALPPPVPHPEVMPFSDIRKFLRKLFRRDAKEETAATTEAAAPAEETAADATEETAAATTEAEAVVPAAEEAAAEPVAEAETAAEATPAAVEAKA